MDDIFKSGYYESRLGYNTIDWFVDEVRKTENKIAFCFKNTMKDIIMTEEDGEHHRKNKICPFCENNF